MTAREWRKANREAAGRFVIVRDASGRTRARVALRSCAWCPKDAAAICSACASRVERARAGIARTDAKRAAR